MSTQEITITYADANLSILVSFFNMTKATISLKQLCASSSIPEKKKTVPLKNMI